MLRNAETRTGVGSSNLRGGSHTVSGSGLLYVVWIAGGISIPQGLGCWVV